MDDAFAWKILRGDEAYFTEWDCKIGKKKSVMSSDTQCVIQAVPLPTV